MSHGHFMEICSRCGNVVNQCRCMGPKEVRHVDGCYKCNASARQEIKVAEQTPTNSDYAAALRVIEDISRTEMVTHSTSIVRIINERLNAGK